MKKLLYYWGIPIAVFCLFVCAGFWIKDLSRWTIFEYYGNIHHPKDFNSETTGQIGDTIGGTTAPFIALMAGFLTFIAFWAQLRANNQVREQFRIQQFESQYFEMIRLHKENINEMKISGYSYLMATSVVKGDAKATETITRTQIERVVDGRKVFVAMVKELNACFNFCVSYAVKFNVPYQDVYEIAYRLFFFGSFSSLPGYDQHKDYIQHCKTELKAIREEHKETFGGKKDFVIDGKTIDLHIKYAPFTGHESRLAHYYRHLFSTVKFVVKKQENGIFDYRKAREYLKILRAQMSNDEQILLYHNYISGLGEDWEKTSNRFLSKYRMLHNLPIHKIKFVEAPRKHFQKRIWEIKSETNGKDPMFEWGDEG